MITKYDCWQFRDNANCWDYVRSFLIDKTILTEKHLPKYGILPSDKDGMHSAHFDILGDFIDCDPVDYSIACHYFKGTLVHVGIVYNGLVLHTSARWGTTKHKPRDFERLCETKYRLHKLLWQP